LTAEQYNYLLGEAEREIGALGEERQAQNLRYLPDYLKIAGENVFDKQALDLTKQQLEIEKLEKELAGETDANKAIKEQLQIEKLLKDLRGDLDYQDKVKLELQMAKNYQAIIKESRNAVRQVGIMNAALELAEEQFTKGEGINAVSQGVLVTFQKMLDPTSVVRESEYARSGNGQSLLQKIEGYVDKIRKGGAGVTIEGLREFVKVGNRFMEQYNKSMLDDALLVQIQADNYGLDLENILPPSMMGTLKDLGKLETEQESQAPKYNSIEEYYIQNLDKQKDLEQMITDNPDLTDEEILEILNSGPGDFSYVDGDTEKIAEAIGEFESGGNYKAIGKETGKGRAYGKYQVMSFNIPNWTKEALGKSMTIKQFLDNPQAQDQVAQYKLVKVESCYENYNKK